MPRDPSASFRRMRRDMDELFGAVLERGGSTHRRGFSPRVDVFYEGDPPRAVVAAELPGVDVSEIRLEIHGPKLVIAGIRRADASEGRVYQQVEIEHGPFRRVVELGAEVVSDQATATYDDGVLRVEVPLATREPETRRVPIGSGGLGEDPPAGEAPQSEVPQAGGQAEAETGGRGK